jgi:quercetin dioxygenase-like cupin family protein
VLAATPEREIALGGARVRILAGAADTGGACAVLDYRMPAGYAGPPAHVHPGFDEIFSVVAGELTVRLDDDVVLARPGDTVVVPGTTAHTFANLTSDEARVLMVFTPGGFESYFEELAALLADQPPDGDAIGKLAERHGVRTVGPPLGTP